MHLTSNCVEIWHPLVIDRNKRFNISISCALITKIKLILQLALDTRQIVSNSRLLLSKGGHLMGQDTPQALGGAALAADLITASESFQGGCAGILVPWIWS